MESSGTGRSAWKSSMESQLLLLFLGLRQGVGPGQGTKPSQPEPPSQRSPSHLLGHGGLASAGADGNEPHAEAWSLRWQATRSTVELKSPLKRWGDLSWSMACSVGKSWPFFMPLLLFRKVGRAFPALITVTIFIPSVGICYPQQPPVEVLLCLGSKNGNKPDPSVPSRAHVLVRGSVQIGKPQSCGPSRRGI